MKQKFLSVWLAFHALILLSFLVSITVSPNISFGTSLFDILPPSSSLHEVQEADAKLAEKTGRAISILAKSHSFETAKSAAEKLYANYVDKDGAVNTDFFDSLSLYVDSNSVAEITAWLHENRFVLLDSETCSLLESGNAGEIAEDALSSVFGAFSFSDLSFLEEDPFLLSERSLKNFLGSGALSATNMTLRDDVLSCESDGVFYVLIRGTVSERGAALTGKKSTVKNVYNRCAEILRDSQTDGSASLKNGQVEFVFSGVPFHSYENSSSAQLQISLISCVSLVLIISVFLWIFRSFLPAVVSALAVAFSCGIGFVSTLLFFRGIHVLTFVFGTTLIGTCLDYSIHYFVNWKANASFDSGTTVRKHILRGITLGFVSTEICFLALFFAPFPLLKQVSVFLFTGLASAYLSVVALYPLLPMPKKKGFFITNKIEKIQKIISVKKLTIYRRVAAILLILSVLVILNNYRSLKIQNNIQELYSMSPELLQNETISAKVLNTGSSGCYFILKADSEEALLQKNDELGAYLDGLLCADGGNYLSVSQFIPPQKRQKENYRASERLLSLVREQYDALGFDPNDSSNLTLLYEKNYRSLENAFIHPSDDSLPTTIKEAVSNLWIGEIDGAYYSCVLPLHLSEPREKSEAAFRCYAETHEGIFFVNKVKDISAQLDELSESMLLMLAIAFVLVIVILFFCYPPRLVLKIASVPLIVTLATTAVLLLCKIHLSFFPITALVLVFGLGLDYIIYAIEGKAKSEKSENPQNLNSFAILLSFVTTALSFGALAISTFPPVHMLGLTVFAGLTTAVVSAFCVASK